MPDDHGQLALSIAMLYHGTSMLMLSDKVDAKLASILKESCIAATDTLVHDAERKSRRRAAD